MDDVLNHLRINCAHMLPQEWRTLQQAAEVGDWFKPSTLQWVAVQGILALVDIRRGYDLKPDGTVQFGLAQICINEHGLKALEELAAGRIYELGEPATEDDVVRVLEADGIDPHKYGYGV
jgi:hypothetical protein